MVNTIISVILYIIRLILPFMGILIVYNCFLSMNRNIRENKPLIMLFNQQTREEIPVMFWENSIGRSKNSDIILDDPTVSRDHAVLYRRDEGWFVSDTNSKSGVKVNDKRISKRENVYLNDNITVGSTQLTVKKCAEPIDGKKYKWTQKRKNAYKQTSPQKQLRAVTVFQILCILELCFINYKFDYKPLIPLAILILLSWGLFLFTKFALNRVTFELETLAIFLSGIGITLICAAGEHQIYTQVASVFIGMIVFLVIIAFIENPDRVMKWRIIISVAAIGLFALNLLIGTVQNGSQNWIMLGPLSIQPSEFVKIAFVFVGASTLNKLQTAQNLTEFIIFSAICIGALFLMGDFGTACVFFVTFLIISFMRSGDLRTIVLICAAAVFGAFIILKFKPYVANRFMAWRHVWEYASSTGYQQTRVLTYTASGGLFGVGLGKGNLQYIFAATSDLIFGMICEEMGLILAITVAISIAYFGIYLMKISSLSRSSFYSIAACSAAGLLIFQSCLNIFGATDLLPLTGVTLPFISMGGSSMVSVWGLLAFIKAADERTYAARRR